MKNILTYRGIAPIIDKSSFIAPTAIVSGDTVIGKNVGIWYGCIIRGDVAKIRIGDDTNIQDNTVIHVTRPHHAQNKTSDEGGPTIIGKGVTIGHNAIIHACIIQDHAFIGMGSIIMDLAVVESYGMLAAGAVLTPGKVVKSGQIWAGNPAKYFRDLTEVERNYIKTSADNYIDLMREYLEMNR
ncbi:MAG: hexapeptide transferase family protein [Rickettsiaceae bacterium]|jgi:carbonic anhydrase/acetyltransferase-like protein (isoleucine patch superfamily)|nr:hexapeptide transferase family protein [Rickettsiaceae bacterium]